jgi:hypothetical protein
MTINQAYVKMEASGAHEDFNAGLSKEIFDAVCDIFIRAQKNAIYVYDDKSSDALAEMNQRKLGVQKQQSQSVG